MKINKLFLFSLVALSVFVLACSTVDEDEPDTSVDASGNVVKQVSDASFVATDSTSFHRILSDSVSRTWNTSLFTLGGSTTFTACRLDDIMTFFEDGSYTYQGGQLCGAEDNRTNRNGSWEVDYENRKIIFDKGSNNEYVADVIGLKDDELRVKGSYMSMEVRGLYLLN